MILITGGLGYLGGRIARHLVTNTDQKVVLSSRSSRDHILKLKDCDLIKMEMSNKDDLDAGCKGMHTIIHLAAMNASQCQEDPERASLINAEGTLKLLASAYRNNVEKFIYFSTAHIYGSPLQGVLNESSIPDPKHPYSMTHKKAEDYVLEFNDDEKVAGVVLRLSNAIGAPIDLKADCWMLVTNNYCKQAVLKKKICIAGDCQSKRDFIPITSVELLIRQLVDFNIIEERIINVGSGFSMTMLELAQLIAKRCKRLFDYNIEIENHPYEISNKVDLEYECKILKSMNIETSKTLADEIDELLIFCQKEFKA